MQQIECSDFERYYFPIPLRMIFGRKQSRFVYSELEKRHPCFSEDYNFDVHVKLQKNKLISDVVVIKNQKLLELKRESISGLFGIKFEGCKHKRFAKLNILPLAFILFFLIFISSLFLLFSGSSESDLQSITEPVNVIVNEEIKYHSADFFQEKLLETVHENNGSVSSLNLSIDGFNCSISAKLISVYPDKMELDKLFSDNSVSTISYLNGKPEFSLSIKEKVSVERNTSQLLQGNEDFRNTIRDFLLKNNCQIVQEELSPFKIRFNCLASENFFSDFDELVFELNCGLSALIISEYSGSNKYNSIIEILCDEQLNYASGFNLKHLADNYSILSFSQKITEKKKDVEKPIIKSQQNIFTGLKKVGEVNYDNGKKMIFYKDLDGKLIKYEEKQQ